MRWKNQNKTENQTLFSEKLDKQDEDDQVLDEIEVKKII